MDYENYFVAFIDILGFKKIIDNSTFEGVLALFNNFNRHLEDVKIPKESDTNDGEIEYVSVINAEDVKYKVMSDSIVFYIKDDAQNALLALVSTCMAFQAHFMNINPSILSRGGVVHGQFYIKGDIMFGKALTSAYLLESQNAKYPRIIMNKSLLDDYGNEMLEGLVFEDFDYFYSIDSVQAILGKNITGKNDFDKFEKHINRALSVLTDNSVREKYIYLKERINKVKNEKEEENNDV